METLITLFLATVLTVIIVRIIDHYSDEDGGNY